MTTTRTGVVMLSGGLASWVTGRLAVDELGADNVVGLFADVKGDATSPHLGEDEDTYRFLDDVTADLGIPLIRVADGRDIWRVFRDKRFLGNSRQANCSHLLKQAPCREWLEANRDPDTTTVYVGIGWDETHRLPGVIRGWDPYTVRAPLTDEGHRYTRENMLAMCEAAGIEVPRLYRAGFAHNNCGGFCVRAGQAQFELLLREHPDRYRFHEEREEELREYLGKPVAILTETVRREPVPLTLRRFRERLEAQPDLFDEFDVGGCGCFVTEEPQE